MQISANFESVQALRDFADAMPYAVNQIVDETERLQNRYRALEPDLGIRSGAFEDIINICMRAINDASDIISDLPAGLRATADQLEEYLNKQLGLTSNSSAEDNAAPRKGQKIKDKKTVTRRS